MRVLITFYRKVEMRYWTNMIFIFLLLQISVHPVNDMDSVYKYIPKEYFASDMGGKAPSFEVLKGIIFTLYYILY